MKGNVAIPRRAGVAAAFLDKLSAAGRITFPLAQLVKETGLSTVIKTGPDALMLRSLLQSPSQVREEGFRLQLSGPTHEYAVEYSTNLTQWELLRNAVLPHNAMEIVDPAATNSPRRIYRARVDPPDAP